MQTDLDMILSGSHYDPFRILGAHFSEPDPRRVTIRTFQPHAEKVTLLLGKLSLVMTKTDPAGLFERILDKEKLPDPGLSPYNYQYEILYRNGDVGRINDPYRYPVLLGEQDQYLFSAGTNYKLYDHLGSHIVEINNVRGCVFRVWAPNARAVSITGGFNGWDRRVHPMRSLGTTGIWELFIPNLGENEYYKYSIATKQGEVLEKTDPFQFYGELRPDTASVVKSLDHHQWNDHQWQETKRSFSPYDKALSIYEVHPGSWRRDPADPDRFLTYRELADSLIPQVKELGFTHIELMPVMEHPLDESWGYQVTGPFSITSRYGTPEEFMYFVDRCHQENIGVILDWVPAHFPKDQHGLGKFDGTSLYEHEDSRKGSHPEWGTFIYNYGRREVSNYLIANVLFWLDKYHIDGIRVDAVASMLYLDYSRNDGEWVPNCYGGRENLEAIEFIRHLNSIVYDVHPNSLLIAEESTSFYGVSKPTDQGGLGFGFKWNMGWMNDILGYFSIDPLYRKYHHNLLTFSIVYAFSENFILPLSHDEVVHGKQSLLDKMPGDIWQKFANLRLLYLTQWMHPGKKLLFMGGEFGQWSEWNCKKSLDWHLLEENKLHSQLFTFMAELNGFYTATPALWENDFSEEGFQWLDLEDRNNSIISYARFDISRKNHIVCVFNYTPQTFEHYKVALPLNCDYRTVFCSDMKKFGGTGFFSREIFKAKAEPYGQADFHTTLSIPPLGGIVLQPVDEKKNENKNNK